MGEIKIVKNKLSIVEASQYINEVVTAYFSSTKNGITFSPFVGKIASRSTFLKYYTDYEFDPNSENVEQNYDAVRSLNISSYKDEIDYDQFIMIKESIDEEVELKKRILMNEQTDEIAKLARKISEVIESIDLSGLDMDALNKFIQKYNQMEINPSEVLKEYMNTETFKQKEESVSK